jgi:hypothetical protein
MRQGWIHYPPRPGHYGHYEYYVDNMAVILFVAQWEVVDGFKLNSYYCCTGKAVSLVRGADKRLHIPGDPFVGDSEAVKKYLETLYITGAIDAYV